MNDRITSARQAALDVLKPSKKDLEHGLELHANSVVCDTYGFPPRSAIDGEAIKAALESGASRVELKDLMDDMQVTRCLTNQAEKAEFMEAWKASGVTCVFLKNAGVTNDPVKLLKLVSAFMLVTDMMPEFLTRATRPEDILSAKSQKKHCFYVSSNGVPLTGEWVSIEEELRYIRVLFQAGVRMMHLTYNRRNMMGDGCGELSDGGLSDLGKAVVAEMNRVGVIVDVAHSGWRTSIEAAQHSTSPIAASHTAAFALQENIRCKPDDVIRAIVDTGGFVGITCVLRFLGGNRNITALLDHIDYVAKRFGPEHVAIGTDIAYNSGNALSELSKVPKLRRVRALWESLWPPGSRGTGKDAPNAADETLMWTNWPIFTVGLVQRGYSDEDIMKILGGNMLRVAGSVIEKSAYLPSVKKGN